MHVPDFPLLPLQKDSLNMGLFMLQVEHCLSSTALQMIYFFQQWFIVFFYSYFPLNFPHSKVLFFHLQSDFVIHGWF